VLPRANLRNVGGLEVDDCRFDVADRWKDEDGAFAPLEHLPDRVEVVGPGRLARPRPTLVKGCGDARLVELSPLVLVLPAVDLSVFVGVCARGRAERVTDRRDQDRSELRAVEIVERKRLGHGSSTAGPVWSARSPAGS